LAQGTQRNLRKRTGDANSYLQKWRSNYKDIPLETATYLLRGEFLHMTILLELEENARKQVDESVPVLASDNSDRLRHAQPFCRVIDEEMEVDDVNIPVAEGAAVNSPEIDPIPASNTTTFATSTDKISEGTDAEVGVQGDDVVFFKEVYTFVRILQHFVVVRKIKHADMDYLLHLFITHRPEVDWRLVPKTCKTLIKIPEKLRDTVVIKESHGTSDKWQARGQRRIHVLRCRESSQRHLNWSCK